MSAPVAPLRPWYWHRHSVAALLFLVVGALATWLGDPWQIQHGAALKSWFEGWPWLLRTAVAESLWGFYCAYLVALVAALSSGSRRVGRAVVVYLLSELLIAALLNRGLKHAFGRPRPFVGDMPWQPCAAQGTRFLSLPSGHSCDAAVGLGAARACRASVGLQLAAVLLTLIVMASRLLQNVHYPSDVVAGAAVGYFGTLLVEWLLRRWWPAEA